MRKKNNKATPKLIAYYHHRTHGRAGRLLDCQPVIVGSRNPTNTPRRWQVVAQAVLVADETGEHPAEEITVTTGVIAFEVATRLAHAELQALLDQQPAGTVYDQRIRARAVLLDAQGNTIKDPKTKAPKYGFSDYSAAC